MQTLMVNLILKEQPGNKCTWLWYKIYYNIAIIKQFENRRLLRQAVFELCYQTEMFAKPKLAHLNGAQVKSFEKQE